MAIPKYTYSFEDKSREVKDPLVAYNQTLGNVHGVLKFNALWFRSGNATPIETIINTSINLMIHKGLMMVGERFDRHINGVRATQGLKPNGSYHYIDLTNATVFANQRSAYSLQSKISYAFHIPSKYGKSQPQTALEFIRIIEQVVNNHGHVKGDIDVIITFKCELQYGSKLHFIAVEASIK